MADKNNMVEQATPQQKKVPIQFYLTEDMKKRLKMYCVANDTNMKDVLMPPPKWQTIKSSSS